MISIDAIRFGALVDFSEPSAVVMSDENVNPFGSRVNAGRGTRHVRVRKRRLALRPVVMDAGVTT